MDEEEFVVRMGSRSSDASSPLLSLRWSENERMALGILKLFEVMLTWYIGFLANLEIPVEIRHQLFSIQDSDSREIVTVKEMKERICLVQLRWHGNLRPGGRVSYRNQSRKRIRLTGKESLHLSSNYSAFIRGSCLLHNCTRLSVPTRRGGLPRAPAAAEAPSGRMGPSGPRSLGDTPSSCHSVMTMFQYSAASRLSGTYSLSSQPMYN